MSTKNQENTRTHNPTPPPLVIPKFYDLVYAYLVTTPNIFGSFSILCSLGVFMTFPKTKLFTCICSQVGQERSTQILVAAAMFWPLMVLFRRKIQRFKGRRRICNLPGPLVVFTISSNLFSILIVLQKAGESALMVFFVAGSFVGYLPVCGFSRDTIAWGLTFHYDLAFGSEFFMSSLGFIVLTTFLGLVYSVILSLYILYRWGLIGGGMKECVDEPGNVKPRYMSNDSCSCLGNVS